MSADPISLSRRKLMVGGGALVVSFSLARSPFSTAAAQAPPQPPRLPGSLRTTPMLDAWIRVDAEGITVFTGKAELGQGIKTALLQVAAEELSVEPGQIRFITADTAKTPNEGYTAGSQSMQDSATAIRHAAAQARELLIGAASARFGVPAEQLTANEAVVTAVDGRRASYRELASAELLHVEAQPQSKLKDPSSYRLIGKPLERVDIPAKVSGAVAYVQDLRLPGMVHARVVRPPSYGARLRSVEVAGVERMPGVLKTVRDGSFLAVVAEREFQAVQAMDALALASQWDERKSLPDPARLYDWVRTAPAKEYVIQDNRSGIETGGRTLEAVYRRPYQLHGSIGPSCAVALAEAGSLTVWTHSQGVYPLRDAIAEMLRMAKDKVHCIHMEGSGCYGHNGADDVAADAALIGMALPGRPVRAQWMRDQEHAWEPFGAAMVHERAGDPRWQRQRSRLALRGVEQRSFDPSGRGRQPDAGMAPCDAIHATGSRAYPAADGWRRSQCHSALPIRQHPRRPSLHSRYARAGFCLAWSWRLYERVFARKLHGRAGTCCRRRSGRIPTAPPPGRAGTRRGAAGGREIRLDSCAEATQGTRSRLRVCQVQEFGGIHGGGRRAGGRARDRADTPAALCGC